MYRFFGVFSFVKFQNCSLLNWSKLDFVQIRVKDYGQDAGFEVYIKNVTLLTIKFVLWTKAKASGTFDR